MNNVVEIQQGIPSDTMVWSNFKAGDDRALDVLLSRHFRPMLHYFAMRMFC